MKKIKPVLLIVTLLTVIVLCVGTFTACSSDDKYDTYAPGSGGMSAEDAIVVTEDNTIVYEAHVTMTVKKLEDASKAMLDKLAELGGKPKTGYMGDYGYYSYTVKIPTENLKDFLGYLREIGTIDSENLYGEDTVSDSYTMLKVQKEALQKQKAIYEARLDEETLTFEQENELREKVFDIDMKIIEYTARINTYESDSAMSTVYISLYEEETYEEPTYWEELGDVLSGSAGSIGKVFGFIFTAIVAVMPYFAILAGLFGLYVLIKFIVCKAKKIPFTLFKKARENAAYRKKRKEELRAYRERKEKKGHDEEKTPEEIINEIQTPEE